MQISPKDRVIIASDVNHRDGIGIEIYRNDKLEMSQMGQGQTLKVEDALQRNKKRCAFQDNLLISH